MNDNFTIKGHVVITDDSGKVLVDTHNMIVDTGRRFIRDIIFGCIINNSDSGKKISNIALIDGKSPATRGNEYETFSNKLYLLNTTKDENDKTLINATIGRPDDYSISFEISGLKLNDGIVGQSDKVYLKINSIGLVGEQKGENNSIKNVLLTRASFDDIIMTQAQSYTITYTLSF